MIVINYVVASQYHKNPYAYKVYKKSSECSQQISRFRSECKNKENSGKRQKALRSMDAQIDISEYKNTEKDYNAYDTVIISENHTVCSNKRNTECYIYKNFKDINKKMM